ncbi:hypothetical protein FF1_000578 [Malus domestica]
MFSLSRVWWTCIYAKCKRNSEADHCLSETVPDRKNRVLWTVMLTGYSQNGDGFKSMKCFRDMRTKGVET